MTVYNETIRKIDDVKNELDNVRPFSESIMEQLRGYYRIGLTYSSNALEGNSLTESETKVVIEDGLTIGGKPLRDTLEAIGHNEAYDFMYQLAKKNSFIEDDIKEVHRLFYHHIDEKEAGNYRKEKVIITGTAFVPPKADKIATEMGRYINGFNRMLKREHGVSASAFVHREFVRIHPFVDGNGRTARILMNLVLLKKGYCITIIPPILRSEYIAALKIGHETGNYEKFDLFVAKRIYESMRELKRLVS